MSNLERNPEDGRFLKMVDEVRSGFDTGRTLLVPYRAKQLGRLFDLVLENYDQLLQALYKDMKKSKMEGATCELEMVKNEIQGTLRQLKKWTTKDPVPFNLLNPLDTAYIKRDPYGVVLIIGAWNYPILLSLQPLIGAIAGGNCAVVKPSENAPNAAAILAELIPNYLDNDCYKVVEGDASDTIKLLECKFDYIFATSSTRIGKSIMLAAAKNLTPVTLELGGKSPVYIDPDSNFDLVTRRILWGKCINLGQTCIAPDYILCSKSVQDEIVKRASSVLEEWYGQNPKNSPDLPRIVNSNHFKRLTKLLSDTKGRVVTCPDLDSQQLWISPTLVVEVEPTDVLMEEEIFGPILPFVTVDSKEQAVKFIKSRPKPLALYVFSSSKATQEYFIDNCSSGAICCNDVLVQNAWEGLPFGGVGDSGMGRYHGKFSFETFTHPKSVLVRTFSKTAEAINGVRYPPYKAKNMKLVGMFMRHVHRFNLRPGHPMSYMVSFVFGVAATMAFMTRWLGILSKKRLPT